MDLGKAPVIEAWIEFRFAASEESRPWSNSTAKAFLSQSYKHRFQLESYVIRGDLTTDPSGEGPTFSPSFQWARACTASGDRYIQVGRDILIYNVLRKSRKWPQYKVLKAEAMEAYAKYIGFTHPHEIRTISLHYRDSVPIPCEENGHIDLERYLLVHPKVPAESFGGITDFLIGITLKDASEIGTMKLTVRPEPSSGKDEQSPAREGRLRMDWHISSRSPSTTDAGEVIEWLDQAHDDLQRVFHESFTTEGWSLFEPTEA